MPELPAIAIVVLVLAVVVTLSASAIQSTIGFGFSLISVPILSLLDPSLAPVPQLLLSIPLSTIVFARERADTDWRGAAWIIVGLLPGIAVGTYLLTIVSGRWLDLSIAAVVGFAVVVMALGATVQRVPATKLAAGVLSGSFNVLSAIGGPPLALLYHGQRGPTVRATMAAIFVVSTSIAIVARAWAGLIRADDVVIGLILLPGVLAGLVVGGRVAPHVEGRPLRILTLVLAAAAAIALMVRALA